MKQATIHRILATIFFCIGCLSCYAQTQQVLSQVDSLTKVVGFVGMIGGFFLAYMQVSLANKVEKVKGEFTAAMSQMKIDVIDTLHREIGRLEDKFTLSVKDIKLEMASKSDIKNDQLLYTSKQETTNAKLEGVKNQLELITKYITEK